MNMNMNMIYPKGSIWRKWDLQVQTIIDDGYAELSSYHQTLKSRSLEKWTTYIAKIGGEQNALLFDSKKYFNDASVAVSERNRNYVRNVFSFLEVYRPDLACIGLTDHNYEHESLLDYFLDYAKRSSLKVLGGVEINVNGIHLLVFFPYPAFNQKTFSEGIKSFLTSIEITTRETNGVLTVTTHDIKKVIDKVKSQKGLIIYPHCNTLNGLFQERQSADRTLLADTFNHSAVNILQARSLAACEAVKGFIDSRASLRSKYCFTLGSDSRSLKDIGRPDSDDNYLWIKGNPTFEGLRQLIYEPEERVHIGASDPYQQNSKIFLDKVRISGSKNYVIPDMTIPLNRELVTVIGGRGSGKSALLESIAFLNEEHGKEDSNGKKKIIEYFRLNIGKKEPPPTATVGLTFVDRDGDSKEYVKELSENENFSVPYLYIGQEQLSSIATNDRELTQKVCDLIGLDQSHQDNAVILEKAREVLAEENILREELSDLEKKYPEFPKGDNFIDWLSIYIKKLEEQKRTLSSKRTKDILEQISTLVDTGVKLQKLFKSAEDLLNEVKITEINQRISELNQFKKDIYGTGGPKDVPLLSTSSQIASLEGFIKSVSGDIESKRKAYLEKRKELAGFGLKEDVNVLLQSAEAVQKRLNSASEDLNSFKNKTDLLMKKVAERNSIYSLIRGHLNQLKSEIDSKFNDFVVSRDTSSQEEKDLFVEVIKGVGIEGEIFLDQNQLCSYILQNVVDKRKIKTFKDIKETIAGRGQGDAVNDITLNKVVDWVEKSLEVFLRSPVFMDGGQELLIKFLFTAWPEFLRINTIVKLNDVPTQRLSIGQRGTLLLKIYFATATVKQVLIVDQPEDNLDNLFIMNELVPLIRKVKKSRQIIMTTHNANLVVNTDAEQIIVARLESSEDYLSGSIEYSDINLAIKEVLEGGEEAFKKRESKYGLGFS